MEKLSASTATVWPAEASSTATASPTGWAEVTFLSPSVSTWNTWRAPVSSETKPELASTSKRTETVCPLPEPDHAALEKLLDYTLDADLFGLSRDHAVIELRNEQEAVPSRGRVLRRMLFPPAAEIETRYTFLKGRRWLLPVAWIVRPFANLRLIPAQLRQMKQVTKTDRAQVEAYDSFMREIGL